jgi:hypothetical protein
MEAVTSIEQNEKRPLLEEPPVIRAVPISAHQVRALESLERAFFGLAADFQRDYGLDGDGEIAGGLFRIWSTLGTINACWKEEAEDLVVVDGWRHALEQIRDGAEDAAQIAAEALR